MDPARRSLTARLPLLAAAAAAAPAASALSAVSAADAACAAVAAACASAAAAARDPAGDDAWAPVPVTGRTLRVGPGGALRTIADAARSARDGDLVEIAAGDYPADVALWLQRRLTIRAVGGPVRLRAEGASVEGKAIWVLRDGEFDVSGITFEGARVPGRNGAGIRFERGRLVLRHCRFVDNEMGVLTGNDPSARFAVRSCEFVGAAPEESLSHNLYVGTIARFDMAASRSSHARHGHLVKSRASVCHLTANRLADGPGGYASYELDLPNGGVAVLVGNVFVQSPSTENDVVVAYGAEGYRWPRNALVMSHNTLVNQRADGVFVRVFPGPGEVIARNNLWVGEGRFDGCAPRAADGNHAVSPSRLVNPDAGDYRLLPRSPLKAKAVDAGQFDGASLRPRSQYVDPMSSVALRADGPLDPGALQGARAPPGR